MNKKVIVAVGLALTAAVAVSGAACWRAFRNGVFTENACAEPFSLTAVFVPTWDFAELRNSQGTAPIESAGTKCAGATAKEACEAAVAAASSKEGWSNGSHGRMPGHHYIVATRGDEVVVINQASLKVGKALGPIDSAMKAAVVAFVERGVGFSCERSVRTVEGGFEVHLVSGSCLGPADEVIRVATSGETTVISAEYGPSTCVGQLTPSPPRGRGSG
jgi:hypothetical protein